MLFLEIAAVLGKNIWFGYHTMMNRQSEVAKHTHYINLSRLREYQMPEKLMLITHNDHEREEKSLERRASSWMEGKMSAEAEASSKHNKVRPELLPVP